MSKYRMLLHGRNFLLSLDGRPRKLGFYTTRFVDARDAESAENAAIDLIRDDPALKGKVLNSRDEPPMIYADEVEEAGGSGAGGSGGGYSWYAEGEA